MKRLITFIKNNYAEIIAYISLIIFALVLFLN
jgi:hypothetical protein